MTVSQDVTLGHSAGTPEAKDWQHTAKGKGMVVARGCSGAMRPPSMRLTGVSDLCVPAPCIHLDSRAAQAPRLLWPRTLYVFRCGVSDSSPELSEWYQFEIFEGDWG